MKIVKYLTIFIFLILTPIYLIFTYGKNVPYSDQKDILDSLKDTASIIFAILGAWIAVIYPKELQKKIFNNETDNNEIIFEKLIYGLILITSVLIVMIISLIFINLIKNISYFSEYRELLRSFLLLYLYGISLVQCYALLVTLMPNIQILIDLIHERHSRDTQNSMDPVNRAEEDN
jgi:uncharacterized membrane protein